MSQAGILSESVSPPPPSGRFPITPFVVGPVNQAGYQTIQSGIDAAHAAGGGTVWIQPGTYVENLVCYDKVNLIGYAGELGASGLYTSSGMVPSVTIQGSLTLNTSAVVTDTFNTFTDLYFTPTSGNLFTYTTNPGTNSAATFIGCTLQVNAAAAKVLVCDGFPIINFENCTLKEGTLNTGVLLSTPGSFKFAILRAVNTNFSVNSVTPCTLEAGSFSHIYLKSSLYSSMIVSSGAGTLFTLDADACTFEWAGSSSNPLVNFGSQDGSLFVDNSIYLSGSGPFSTSSTVNPFTFIINNTYFDSPYVISGNSQDQYTNCIFQGGSSAAVTMSSTGAVKIENSVINSSANPALAGAGAGTLTLAGITFPDGKNISASLTVSTTPGYFPANYTAHGVLLGEGAAVMSVTNAGFNGQVLLGATTADPAFGTLTSSDSSILFTTGANSLSMRVAGGTTVGKTITGDSGGALSPTAGNWNLLGSGSITTAGSGSILTTQLTGLTNHSVLVGAGTTTITKLSVGTNGQVLVGSTGADPAFATLTSTGGTITYTTGANSLNLEAVPAGGGVTWSVVTVNGTFAVNTGTIANKAGTLAMALPTTSAVGSIIEITGINTAAGWQITQAANQQIFFGTSSTTLGATGTLTSTAIRDSLKMVCVTANLTWNVLSSIGNITVA